MMTWCAAVLSAVRPSCWLEVRSHCPTDSPRSFDQSGATQSERLENLAIALISSDSMGPTWKGLKPGDSIKQHLIANDVWEDSNKQVLLLSIREKKTFHVIFHLLSPRKLTETAKHISKTLAKAIKINQA